MEFLNKYAKKDYGYVTETSIIICPHCGKVMNLLPKKKWSSYEYYHYGDEDSWGGWTIAKTETFICEECGIEYKHEISAIRHPEAEKDRSHWILPKKFKSTCTQKQLNYINFLCNTNEHNIYVTSLEQANKLINDLLTHKKAEKDKKTFRANVVNKLKAAGFDCNGFYTDIMTISKEDITKGYSHYTLDWNSKTINYNVKLYFNNTSEITPEIIQILETTKANKEAIEKILNEE